MISQNELHREAAITGFQMEPLEKVIHLLELLESLRITANIAEIEEGKIKAKLLIGRNKPQLSQNSEVLKTT